MLSNDSPEKKKSEHSHSLHPSTVTTLNPNWGKNTDNYSTRHLVSLTIRNPSTEGVFGEYSHRIQVSTCSRTN